ncbi:condensin-2 complex subunit D3-like isoform X3 [Varroa destructor]|nr:condensin-2 complex subunit D3-like isoform X3 [Varroa destructor]XP_022648228.1 condensin-2 complex subunit D3-like isoform X3 [Varroa destructor]
MLSLPVSNGNASSSSFVTPKRNRSVSTESRSVTVDDEVYPIETLQDYVEHITEALDSLRLFLTSVSLEEHDDVVSALCQHMAVITENEMLSPQAYEVLGALCDRDGLHGDLPELLKLVSFKLNGNLLMLKASVKDQVPRAMVKARDTSLRFLMCMRDRVKSDEYLIVTIQQLAMRSLEKADIRFRTAQGVLQLVLQLEEESLTQTLHWFHKMIRSKIPRHRMFTLELFGQICSLQNTPQALRRHFSNIALASLERVMDDLATVKAKAFAFFSQLTNTPHWMDNLVTNECSHEDVIGALLGILNECVKDSKVHVRKSALNVLNGILCGDTEFDKGPYVDVIVRCCRDQTILVRKHALECLLKVYRRHPTYNKEFVSGVFPLTMDNEPSVQEKALACVLDVIFDSILPGHVEDSAWNVLKHLGTYERYLPLICEQLCKKEGKVQLNDQHIRALTMALKTVNASLAWKLLSYLCNHTHVSLSGFDACEDQLDDDAQCCRLSVLLTQSRQKKEDEHYLESLLTILNDPATSFMRLAHVCSILLHLDRSQLVRWADVTFPNCLAVMEQAVEDETEDSVSENDLLSAMFKSGECVLVIPNLADLRLCALLRTIVQESKQPLAVRRMALRVLGQISLVSMDLAKRLVTLIGDTVDNAHDLSLRVIGIRTVADLSCRYAALTDSLLPVVYCLLKDPETEVRRAAITNLLQLLKEEYIKLRNNFLYHMLECVLDDDEMLRDLSEFGLDQFVLKKNPNIFLHNFIDCVFHLNAYRGHSLYNQVLQTPREIATFSLVGQPLKRQIIYRFMVRRLTDEHKFLLTLNICNNVLKAIADNETAVDRECPAIVIDLLEVLCMDELRLRVTTRGDEEEAGTEFTEDENNGLATASSTPVNSRHTRKKEQFILNAIKLKTMIESILPPLTMLKSRCEDNEELMTALMSYLNVLNHEYKNELKSLLVGNSASEFYNDLKKFEASRTRLDDTVTGSIAAEDPQQESKMKLIMKVLQSARKQQRAILNRDQEEQQITKPLQTKAGAATPMKQPVGISEAPCELIDEISAAKVVFKDRPTATIAAENGQVEAIQQKAPDNRARDIPTTKEAKTAKASKATSQDLVDTRALEKTTDDIMELSGIEPLTEEYEVESERPQSKNTAENGIPVEEGFDTQQSNSENVWNGVADTEGNENKNVERKDDSDSDSGPPVPLIDNIEQVLRVVEEAPCSKPTIVKAVSKVMVHNDNSNAIEQNGFDLPLNGHVLSRTKARKRRFREMEDEQRAAVKKDVVDNQHCAKKVKTVQDLYLEKVATEGTSKSRKRRRSASTTSSTFQTPQASHNSKRLRQNHKNDITLNNNCTVVDRAVKNNRETPSSSVPFTPRRLVSKRSRNIRPESTHSGLLRSRSTAGQLGNRPFRSGSVDSRLSSTVSSLVSTRSSVRARPKAAAASSLEARWKHEYNLMPCEVIVIRNPVVEICAKEMRNTGQSIFRMVTNVPHRAAPVGYGNNKNRNSKPNTNNNSSNRS